VQHDSTLALQWFRKAADLGDGEAWLRISKYHLHGTLMPKDTARYFAIRKEWADKGLPNGLAALGACYEYGIGCKIVEDGQQHKGVQRWQSGRHMAGKMYFLAQRAGVFFLCMNHEPGDFIRRHVVIDPAVLGQLLQSCVNALLIFLDIVTLAGNA
jgi:TPR repeat protein